MEFHTEIFKQNYFQRNFFERKDEHYLNENQMNRRIENAFHPVDSDMNVMESFVLFDDFHDN